MSTWAPQEQGLQEVYIVLRDSTQNENAEVQKEMTMVSGENVAPLNGTLA